MAESRGKYEYESQKHVVKNPPFDPRSIKQYLAYDMSRVLRFIRKDYSLWPIVSLNAIIIPTLFIGFQYYRITHVPEVWSPNSHPHWDKWEHRWAKLGPLTYDREALMKKHGRPQFEWKYPEKPSKWHYLGTIFGGKSSH